LDRFSGWDTKSKRFLKEFDAETRFSVICDYFIPADNEHVTVPCEGRHVKAAMEACVIHGGS